MDEYQHPKSGKRAPHPVRTDADVVSAARRDTTDSVLTAGCVFAAVLVIAAAVTLINQSRQPGVDDASLTSSVRIPIPRERDPVGSAYYRNCDAARAAGVAPIPLGAPGYRSELDGDADGLACEPYPR